MKVEQNVSAICSDFFLIFFFILKLIWLFSLNIFSDYDIWTKHTIQYDVFFYLWKIDDTQTHRMNFTEINWIWVIWFWTVQYEKFKNYRSNNDNANHLWLKVFKQIEKLKEKSKNNAFSKNRSTFEPFVFTLRKKFKWN